MALIAVSAALLAAASEKGGGGLTDVNWVLTVSTIVLFGLFALVLGRFGWKPLLHMIEERERSIREAIEGSHKANAEAQALLEKHKEMLREAGREREEIIKRTMKEAEHLNAELATKARAESDQMIQRARDQIATEKNLAIRELRAQVADIAVAAAAKIVTSSLTPEVQKKLVSDYIAALPTAK